MAERLLPLVLFFVGIFYLSPLLHEYCHAIAVRRLGGTVTHIGPTRGLFRLRGWRCEFIPPRDPGKFRWKARVIGLAPLLVGLAIPTIFVLLAVLVPRLVSRAADLLTEYLDSGWFWVLGVLWLDFMLGISLGDLFPSMAPRGR